MKTVKEICLGVAVAGVVAGAGSAVGCAVAYADSPNADSASASDTAQSPARTPARPSARSRTTGAPGTAAPAASAPSGNATRGVAAGTLSSPRSTGNDGPRAEAPRRAALPVTVAGSMSGDADSAPATAPETPVSPADASPAPAAASNPGAPAAVAPAVAPAPLAPPVVNRIAYAAAAVITAPPSEPLLPLAPLPVLPTPLLPAVPASAASYSSTSGSSRSRAASVTASVVQIGDPAHVLLIGTDGTNLSKILADPANTGFFNLMAESVTGATSLVGHTTISNPSWSTILTGVWDNKTGIINNIFDPAPYRKWPTVFNQLEAFNPNISTAVVADWKVINQIAEAGGYPVDKSIFVDEIDNSWAATDAQVTSDTIGLINATDAATPTFIFSYQVQVDEAGHSFGGGSPEYREAVTNTSNNISAIMAAVKAWETTTGQDWTVIVTTDHGHQQSLGFGHGFQSPNETSSFIIADFAGDSANDGKQNLNYSNVDITPTIVSLFGAPLRSDFDGSPMNTTPAILNAIVTPVNSNAAPGGGLNQSLTDAVNAFGYPNIGTDLALGLRTVVGSVPYFLNGFVTQITAQLNSLAAANIFLLSPLAGAAAFVVQFVGDALVAVTNGVANVVGYLTGAGTIAPTDPPLPAPPAGALLAV